MSECCGCVGGIVSTQCPAHGLFGDMKFEPMDRHALPGETAAEAQRRLYLESRGEAECILCGRVGKRGFVDTSEPLAEAIGRVERRKRCKAWRACCVRERRRKWREARACR